MMRVVRRLVSGRTYLLLESSKHYHVVIAGKLITAVPKEECEVLPPRIKEELHVT